MIERTKERIKQTGEIFTPHKLVDEILSKLDPEVWKDPSKTFLDNSCGDGNFLVRVIAWKIHHGSTPEQALNTTHGVDFQQDNVKEARERVLTYAFGASKRKRLLECIEYSSEADKTAKEEKWRQIPGFKKFKKQHMNIVARKIVWHDALTYHYNFDGTVAEDKYKDQSCDC